MTATRTVLCEAPAGLKRRECFLRNDGGDDCFIGGRTVTATTGFRLSKDRGENSIGPINVPAGLELHGICEAGKSTIVHVLLQLQGEGS